MILYIFFNIYKNNKLNKNVKFINKLFKTKLTDIYKIFLTNF